MSASVGAAAGESAVVPGRAIGGGWWVVDVGADLSQGTFRSRKIAQNLQ
jgi:hypothetical protein